ncbi:MAG: hypothetical protein EBR82_35475 [Caulobacteraceae bacterium]|nr:hypothetical protein [Caulobacteraceae bacterium]
MATCPAVATGDLFLSTLLRHIDCQAQTIGTTGYQALSDPGSPVSLALTGILTIFVAVFGLRLILGGGLSLRDGVMAVVKIGVVLLIATSWPAYRAVVYDLVVDGPAEIGALIGRPAGLPTARGELIDRLQAADVAINQLINQGSGRGDTSSAFQTPNLPAPGEPERRYPIRDDSAFGSARVVFLSGAIAAFAVVRLTAGLLLALAPLFAGLLLFDMARGLFVGWARALVFALLASVATTVILGVELALLEPWLAEVLRLRLAHAIVPAAPVELMVMCLAFALALLGALGVILRLSFMISLPRAPRIELPSVPSVRLPEPVVALSAREDPGAAPRALGVARALAAAQRREQQTRTRTLAAAVSGRAPVAAVATASAAAGSAEFTVPALGQPLRRTRPRKSVGATLRDRRS